MSAEITSCVKEFYFIEAVSALAKPEPFRHSHERWLREFTEYKGQYSKKLAAAIFDYSVLVCYGEMRHGRNHCRYYNPYMPYYRNRSSSYEGAKKYNPVSILRAAITLFDCEDWDSGYGGYKWKLIAETALKRAEGRVGWSVDEVFIDRCVDLSHNGSIYFDKSETGIFWLRDNAIYKGFLDLKLKLQPKKLLSQAILSEKLYFLIVKAINLKILPPININIGSNENINFILHYSPISWGDEILPNEIEENEYYDEDDDYDEEEDYEEECKEEEESYWDAEEDIEYVDVGRE